MAKDDQAMKSILEPGRNCWRIEQASCALPVVDAADYFAAIRLAMLQAKRRIMLIGWDFDTRIQLGSRSGETEEGPTTLGDFVLWLARRRRDLQIYILKWDVGAIKLLFRGSTLATLIRWRIQRNIQFKFDGAHPPGCSHHQKIVVIDDSFAVCGGIDMTADRWDTSAHKDDDPNRLRPNRKPYGPWHDVTMLLEGDAAKALAELGMDRWALATGQQLQPTHGDGRHWPEGHQPDFTNVSVAISRTRATYKDCEQINEIEVLYLDMIKSAKRFIYAENQYFTSRKIAEAIATRMEEANPPEIMIVAPRTADGWLEQKAMDGARTRLLCSIGEKDKANNFRIYTPVTEHGEPIYVHAKVMIVDDRMLRIGSSNMNNRSLGLDSECDVTIDVALPGNGECGPAIAALRTRLMAEHLGVEEVEVERRFNENGSLLDTVDALAGKGKTLRLLRLEDLDPVEEFIADNEILDPEQADGFFEPLTQRGLFRRWRKLRPPK